MGRKRGTHLVVGHEALDHGGVKSGVNMAPKDGRGHIKSTPDFSLCEAMHVLCEVVRQLPSFVLLVCALHQRRPRNNLEAQQEGTDERRDQRRGGAHPGLVHVANGETGRYEFGELAQRGHSGRQATRLELFALRIEIVVPYDRDVEPARAQQNGPHGLRGDSLMHELECPL